MRQKLIELGKNLGKILLFAVIVLAVICVVSFILDLAEVGDGITLFWRICCIVGAIILLVAAVLLITDRKTGRKMKWWEESFPGFPFTAAILLVAAVLLVAGGIVNYVFFDF